MEKVDNRKDEVIGEAKKNVVAGAPVTNVQKESETPKPTATMTPQDMVKRELSVGESAEIHLQKGKLFEELGSKTDNKNLVTEGQHMQQEARGYLEQGEGHEQEEEEEENTKKEEKETADLKKEGEKQKEHQPERKDGDAAVAAAAADTTTPTFDPKEFEEQHKNEKHFSKEELDGLALEQQQQQQKGEEAREQSSAMETLSTMKDKVVGGVKSVAGAVTGNEDWQKEGERQRPQGKDSEDSADSAPRQEEVLKREFPVELSPVMHLKKGKVSEDVSASQTEEKKDVVNEGKKMQKEARQQYSELS